MSRSFFSRASPNTTRDQSPLLPQHRDSVPLSPISPRSSISQNRSTSPSPPPSFYRSSNAKASTSERSPRRPQTFTTESRTYSESRSNFSHSPNPPRSRTKIQFAAPPAPIASSVFWSPDKPTGAGGGRPSSASSYGSQERDSRQTNSSSTILRVRRGSGGIDPLLGLERKERAIQKELQLLLDAQSAGLVQGFGRDEAGDGVSDAGSSTPTMSTSTRHEGRGVTPVRQPKRKVIGLRSARRGLGRDMGELIAVKSEEVGVLDSEIGRREDMLAKVGVWEGRIEGARKKLSDDGADISGEGKEGREISDLQKEERALETEIRDLEDRVSQMRARKKWLGERIREASNRREARLSSYKGALREVEGEVREFLRRPPLEVSVVMREEEGQGFMELPVGRRTLGMASEWWGREVGRLEERKQEVEKERVALEEGREMWESCVNIVVGFEDGLRREMGSGETQSAASLKTQIGKMRAAIELLEAHFKEAEKKGWNLLICAVGAELEAFKEGEGVLKGVLEMVAGQEYGEEEREDSFHSTDDGLNTLAELNGAVKREESESTESEDDGPNLEVLLVDRGRGDVD